MLTAQNFQQSQTKNCTFAPIPNWLLRRTEISYGAKVTYGRLKQYARNSGVAFPKRESLAEEIGAKIRTLDSFLRELTKHNLIVINRVGSNRPNEYELPAHIWMKAAKTYTKPECKDSYIPECKDSYTPYKDEKIIRKDNIIQNKKDFESSQEIREEFERWWNVYPRRQNKEKAFSSYVEARKRVSFEILFRKARSYARYRERVAAAARGRDYNSNQDLYTLAAHTWLDRGCWEECYGRDEVTSDAPLAAAPEDLTESHEVKKIRAKISEKIGEARYRSWFAGKKIEVSGSRVIIQPKSRFEADYINTHMLWDISKSLDGYTVSVSSEFNKFYEAKAA